MRISFLVITIVLIAAAINAASLKFAIVPKEGPSPFFLQCRDGAMDAAANIGRIECVYRGPEETSVRLQNQIVEQLIREGVNGIALAVTESNFLARNCMASAKKAGIPLITFDADLDPVDLEADPDLRLAYIGTDNYEFGKALGRELVRIRPQGGRICIQSGREGSPNLDLRIKGLRAELAGKAKEMDPTGKLTGENNWTEVFRSPLYSWDRRDHALSQLVYAIESGTVDAFISVGGWPMYAADYRTVIQPFKSKIASGQIALVIGDTTPTQLKLLKDGLGQINVGQRPYDMGKHAIETLYKIVKGKPYKKLIHTPLTYCTPENYQTCTHSQ